MLADRRRLVWRVALLASAWLVLTAQNCDDESQYQTFVRETSCSDRQLVCDGRCIDIFTDRNNCGACFLSCGSRDFCVSGYCDDCTHPFAVCGDSCVDVERDPDHCGDCFRRCSTNQRCVNGVCERVRCDGDWLEPCEHECVDTRTDRDHCGSCNFRCSDFDGCDRGQCGPLSIICTTPNIICGWRCINPEVDNAHCGRCGRECDFVAGEICNHGRCTCPHGWIRCDGECINPSIDPGIVVDARSTVINTTAVIFRNIIAQTMRTGTIGIVHLTATVLVALRGGGVRREDACHQVINRL